MAPTLATTKGRANFLDAATGETETMPAVPFDPTTSAWVEGCPSGDFARTPSCWNFADFRRRVWGLAVRRDPANEQVRLYYAVWGSQGFGNPDYASADEGDQRNSIWSVDLGLGKRHENMGHALPAREMLHTDLHSFAG